MGSVNEPAPARPPGSSPSARRAPAGAARGSAGSRPRGQLGAVRPRREGPAGEGRRRLQEVRAAAQGEAAEGPAKRGHGRGDEEAASAAPTAHVPRPGAAATATAVRRPPPSPLQTPTSLLLEPSTPDRPGAGRDLLCAEGCHREGCRDLQSVHTTGKMAASA